MHTEHKVPFPKSLWRWLMPLIGLVSLLWFLVRVLPKPSRASYPCQRVAFPLASGFVVWLVATFTSITAFRKARLCLRQSRYAACAVLALVAVACIWSALSFTDDTPARADPPVPNAPIGEGKGVHPGRVTWVFDPDVTTWEGGTGEGSWWFEHVDSDVLGRMFSRAIRSYAGVDEETAAWETIFRQFNRGHGRGDRGYASGEKIAVKLNLVACFAQPGSNRVDSNYDKTDSWKDNIDTHPGLVHALLDHLVNIVGVAQGDITIGDPTGLFPNYLYDPLHADFPEVRYWDSRGTLGRTAARYSTTPFYWSKPGLGTVRQDYVPVAYAEAAYLINFAILKSHDLGGITTCGKNHYGSLIRLPTGAYRDDAGVWHGVPGNPSYYDYHQDLPGTQGIPGRYRNRVDFMAHPDVGGKTILYLIDAILAGRNWSAEPEPWTLPPFDRSGGWPSSLFVSMDPVAVDSVAFDFLLEQWPDHAGMSGTSEYLVEAALAHDPPSGTFYDPGHPGNTSRASSLGVHEHWNNPVEKKYSRDLDPDATEGIELILVDEDRDVLAYTDRAPAIDGEADGVWDRTFSRLFPHRIVPPGGGDPAARDLSGSWKALWDATALYLLVDVVDEQAQSPPSEDGITVFIDADASAGAGAPPPNLDGTNDFVLFFSPGDPQIRPGTHSAEPVPGIVFQITGTQSGYRLEAALPWSTLRALPDSLEAVKPGTRIGLDVHLSDADESPDSPEHVLAWHATTTGSEEDASLLRTVTLSTDPGAGSILGTLIERGAAWRYLRGREEASAPCTAWTAADFDDSGWEEGPAPVGYGDPPFGTSLDDMRDDYTTVFLRGDFEVPQGLAIDRLWLSVDYDDGFRAWVNGMEVLQVNAPGGDCLHDALALENHESGSYQRFALASPESLLVAGRNVLAVQGFNVNPGSSDFKLDLEITYRATASSGSIESFLRGDSDGSGSLDLADAVHMLLALFAGGDPGDCADARDTDDNGELQLTDAVMVLNFLFLGGPPPGPPFPVPGPDPTTDGLGCGRTR